MPPRDLMLRPARGVRKSHYGRQTAQNRPLPQPPTDMSSLHVLKPTFFPPPPMALSRKRPLTAAPHPYTTTIATTKAKTDPPDDASPLASFKRPRRLIDSYTPAPFQPYLSSNPHFQTIVPHFYPVPTTPDYTRVALQSDDGLALFYVDIANGTTLSPTPCPDHPTNPISPAPPFPHTPSTSATSIYSSQDTPHVKPSNPVAVVLTGLESNSTAHVTCRLVNALTSANFKVFVLNHRSCAGPEDKPSTLRLYHAAFTDDLRTLLRAISHTAVAADHCPPPIYLCGFSLGANIVCHFLAQTGTHAQSRYNVAAAAAACVPFDPTACQQELDSGWKGQIYSRNLIKKMHGKFNAILTRNNAAGGSVDPERVRGANRLGKIDDHLICRVFGFRDRFEYYRFVDARFVLADITVPTLVMNARDDPLFDHACGRSLPTREQIGGAPVKVVVCDSGGHCGFLDKETIVGDGGNSGYFQREFAKWFQFILAEKGTVDYGRVTGEVG